MWRARKDGGLARADHVALGAVKAEVPSTPTKTYSLLGIARGTGPTVRATALTAPDELVNSVPDLTRRIAIVVLGTMAAVSMLSVFVRSPLEEPANALVTPNPAKAPWYFLWLQEIVTDTTVKIGSFTVNGAFLGGVVLPALLLGVLTVWPWLDRSPNAEAGRWFPKTRRVQNAVFLAIAVLILLLTLVGTFCRGPYWHFFWPWQAWPEVPSRI
jgi:quinol-cytochrome oxidoreductase complex cytochrome b subunit